MPRNCPGQASRGRLRGGSNPGHPHEPSGSGEAVAAHPEGVRPPAPGDGLHWLLP